MIEGMKRIILIPILLATFLLVGCSQEPTELERCIETNLNNRDDLIDEASYLKKLKLLDDGAIKYIQKEHCPTSRYYEDTGVELPETICTDKIFALVYWHQFYSAYLSGGDDYISPNPDILASELFNQAELEVYNCTWDKMFELVDEKEKDNTVYRDGEYDVKDPDLDPWSYYDFDEDEYTEVINACMNKRSAERFCNFQGIY